MAEVHDYCAICGATLDSYPEHNLSIEAWESKGFEWRRVLLCCPCAKKHTNLCDICNKLVIDHSPPEAPVYSEGYACERCVPWRDKCQALGGRDER
jgi:hypothetical protein